MNLEELAKKILRPQKGILAADWSVNTATKKFEKFGITSNEQTRRKYRQMLFESDGLENYISAVILHEETIRQKTDEGKPLVEILKSKGIVPGIRVDIGQEEMPEFNGEQLTFGLDKIRDRLKEFKSLGAEFGKWRAAFVIGRGQPSYGAIEANSVLLALYALFCLEAEILPIVEPDIVMDGDHSIEDCFKATDEVLKGVFLALYNFGVDRKKIILKPSMVLPGKDSQQKIEPQEVARQTMNVFKNDIPVDVPGIAFLSGGQSFDEAVSNLNEIEKMKDDVPWQITFSFARALQEPVLEVWQGRDENKKAAQEKLVELSRIASLARQGKL
ncbi:MAG: fructose-bisphosphate aldolase [Patescibacteria group bacterium]|nr:MAG: fructose-bisphosphate aldolase [Patescibacteria group bacterium]